MSVKPPMRSSGWSQGGQPLPYIPLPLQSRSPTQLSSQPLFSAWRSSRWAGKKKKKTTTQKTKSLNQPREEEGGREEEKTPWKLSSLRARKSDTILSDCRVVSGRSSVPWAEEKGRGHVSRMLKLLWDFMSADECSEVRTFDSSKFSFLLEYFFCFWQEI